MTPQARRNVVVAGGANVVQQAVKAGLVDELRLHLAPILLGSGTRLLDDLGGVELERTAVIDSPGVTHLTSAWSSSRFWRSAASGR